MMLNRFILRPKDFQGPGRAKHPSKLISYIRVYSNGIKWLVLFYCVFYICNGDKIYLIYEKGPERFREVSTGYRETLPWTTTGPIFPS